LFEILVGNLSKVTDLKVDVFDVRKLFVLRLHIFDNFINFGENSDLQLTLLSLVLHENRTRLLGVCEPQVRLEAFNTERAGPLTLLDPEFLSIFDRMFRFIRGVEVAKSGEFTGFKSAFGSNVSQTDDVLLFRNYDPVGCLVCVSAASEGDVSLALPGEELVLPAVDRDWTVQNLLGPFQRLGDRIFFHKHWGDFIPV